MKNKFGFGDDNQNYKHGHYLGGKPSRTYTTWCMMKQRCHNKKHSFQSQIRAGGKTVYLGRFKCELKAAKAYDKYIIDNCLPNKLNLEV